MNLTRREQIEELFQQAADLTGDARSKFLASSAFEDAAMRTEVEELLRHYEQAEKGFLSSPIQENPGAPPATQLLPTEIGNFQVLKLIGEGGMGVVYEARQQHPRRIVALKLIRGAVLSPGILKRFKHEADVLARLQHPGIAQIFEAGQAHTGQGLQPYFAMELVRGRPLLAFAEQNRLTTRQRLDLFARVCDAIQYAHERGVIHRDLKPGNILVEDAGVSGGRPKVLDFGIALVTSADASGATRQTEVGQVLGTLGYMSPEQLGSSGVALDVRSDVYALGVILHELLTGRQPLDLKSCSLADAARIVRDQEPTLLGQLNTAFRGDVETIVAKAIEKEKDRRYASVAALAADIRAHLADQPIAARPVSRIEHLRKFTRRNKLLVASIASIIVALSIGIVGTGMGLVRARRAEKVALERMADAQRETARAASVNEFLQKMLSAVDPAQSRGNREVTVSEVIDDALRLVNEGSLASQPDTEAEVRITLGKTLTGLGKYEKAEEQFKAALEIRRQTLGEKNMQTAAALGELANVYVNRANFAAAEKAYRDILSIQDEFTGLDDPGAAQTMNSLAGVLRRMEKFDEAGELYRRSLAILQHAYGQEHLDIAQGLNSLGMFHQNLGELAKAEDYFRQSLNMRKKLLGELHPIVAGTTNNLGNVLWSQRKFDEALPIMQEALAMRRKLFGNEHPDVAQSVNNIAAFLQDMDRLDEAEPLYREAADINRKLLGENHPEYAANVFGLASLLRDKNHLEEAERLYREALRIRLAAFGPDHLLTAGAHSGLAALMLMEQRYDEAEAEARETMRVREPRLPPTHWVMLYTKSLLGDALSGQGKFEEAEPLLREAFDGINPAPGIPARRLQEVRDRLIWLYERWNKPEEVQRVQALAVNKGTAPK